MFERAKIAFYGLAFAALFGFLVFQAGIASQHPKNQGQQTAAAQDHEQKNIFERVWEWTTHDPVAFYTSVLALSTIGLWIVTYLGIRNQSREMRVLQRAYVAVDAGGIKPFGHAVPPYSIAHIEVRNVGNLPARKVRWFIDSKISPDGQLDDFPIDDGQFYGNNVISPGTQMDRSQDCGFSYEQAKALEKQGLFLYVWGEIRYFDGFEVSRFTRFCHRYGKAAMGYGEVAMGGGYVGGVPMLRADGMRFHQFGNDAD
jgi:hypothetical protein